MGTVAAENSAFFPRAFGMIERHRLLDHLSGVFEHKLTIICAPPGYGKTTLTGQFVQQSQRPFAWHTVEERDRDLPNLLAHSLAALAQVSPDIKKLGPLTGYSPRELAAVITNYLRESAEDEFLYILDDVHYLTGSPAAETWLQALVAMLPPKCHLILLSRALPNLPITEMVARREVLAIGQDQLRFTGEEITRLADSFGNQVTFERAKDLYDRLEGWPAGTVLAFQPLPSELEAAVLKGGKGPEALFEALAVGVLQSQPPALRNFLLESSTLSHITPELCETVLEIPNSVDRFADALNRHTFLTQVPGGLIYHRLFRQFLQQELYDRNPTRFTSLHLKAAWWFEQHDRLEEAVEHYVTAGQLQFAVVIAERVAQAYYAQGKVETLLGWKESFNNIAESAPRLFLNCAKIHSDRYDYPTALTELTFAEQGFIQLNDRSGLAEVQLQIARSNLQRGKYEDAVKQSLAFLKTWKGENALRGRALRTLGFAQMRLGNISDAITNLETAIPIYRADGDAHALSQLLQDVVVAYAQAGRLKEVSTCLQEVVALLRSLGSPSALAHALNNLGYFYHRSSEYQQALQTLGEGLSVILQVSNKRTEGHLLWSMGDVKRDLGAFDESLHMYYKALELIGTSEPPVRCSILLSISTQHRWQGNYGEAVSMADEAAAVAESHKLAYETLLARTIGWAARSKTEYSSDNFEQLQEFAAELSSQYAQFETLQALGCCAQVALQAKETSLAEEFIQSAVVMAQNINTSQPLVAELIHTPNLATFVDRNPNWKAVFHTDKKRLVDTQNGQSTAAPQQNLIASSPTYSIRVWTLGMERIERDGKKIISSEWRAALPRELFLYLLLEGPSTRDEISLTFWPDSSPAKIRNIFHSTLYRARQALGDNVIELNEERYQINPNVDLWCDFIEMQKRVHEARQLTTRGERTEDLWRKAVELYRGDFATSINSEWAIYPREKFHEIHLDALVGAATCIRARGNPQEAINFLKRALQVDRYREDIYRSIMQSYADLGEQKQIATYFHDLERLLKQDLAITPSQETISLVQRLLQ